MSLKIKLLPKDKNMSNGSRRLKREPLSSSEIEYVTREAGIIKIDTSILIFNDPLHIKENNTCYNFEQDKIYIAQNVFPDEKYGSIHPRDLMSVKAVLAHEYYGHRQYRNEYISDWEKGPTFHTTPIWQDECRASITAAKIAPNLSNKDRANLLMDAIKRAEEAGHYIEMDEYMKGVIYGDYTEPEKSIVPKSIRIKYVSISSERGNDKIRKGINRMPQMPQTSKGVSR